MKRLIPIPRPCSGPSHARKTGEASLWLHWREIPSISFICRRGVLLLPAVPCAVKTACVPGRQFQIWGPATQSPATASGKETTDMSELLRVENLFKAFPAKKRGNPPLVAVNGVSFTVGEGETLGLVGESGCGKTTLGRSVLRLVEPDSGSIIYRGSDLMKMKDLRPLRQKLQIVFQNPSGSLDPRMQVTDIISEGLRVHRMNSSKQEMRELVDHLMREVGLGSEYAAIIYLYNAIKDGKHYDWGEVSEMLYLFRGRKWTDQDAKQWLYDAWNYLGYGK